jgi:hypothetical protein
VTLWARFRAAGLPADIAAVHYPAGELIALGVRGIVVILAGIAFFAAVFYALILIFSYSVRLWGSTLAAGVRDQNLLDASALAVRRLRLGHFRLLALLGVAVVVGAGFASWRWFAGVISIVAVTGVALHYFHQRGPGRTRPSLALIVITLLVAGAAGTAWQIQPPVLVQAVVVVPMPEAKGLPLDYLNSVKDVAVPYLGETRAHVYVAEITPRARVGPGDRDWAYSRRILELPRNGVRLIFPSDKGELVPDVPSPASALWHAIV